MLFYLETHGNNLLNCAKLKHKNNKVTVESEEIGKPFFRYKNFLINKFISLNNGHPRVLIVCFIKYYLNMIFRQHTVVCTMS